MVKATHAGREEGFSLIELMVVIAILGVLTAISIPNFLSAQAGARSKTAQSNARAALSAAKAVHTEHSAYWVTSDAATLAVLQAAEPSLGWGTSMGAPSPGVSVVSWTTTNTELVVAVRAVSGECFYVRDNVDSASASPGTSWGKTVGTDATTCDADAGAPVWKGSQTQGWPKDGASA